MREPDGDVDDLKRPQIAVTGGNGRLGRALLDAAEMRGMRVASWSRPSYDLDDPAAAARALATALPATVIHSAAWTDVDGCARDPQLAMRRNGAGTAELAAACAAAGVRLALVSTNEVFDGKRRDGLGYREDDPRRPINPYGESKLAGEEGAAAAFQAAGWPAGLVIVRTAWLYGPPGNDFPTKILAAADRLPTDQPLRVVDDEIGSPTFTLDLADAVLDLLGTGMAGTFHLVNGGRASRLDAASLVLGRLRPARSVAPISRTAFVRPSVAPAWAVLDGSLAAASGVRLRPWEQALEEYAATLD